ncbi:MAG: AtpZ/AtpI family protein [Alphaproteobacteria bacterium]|nr:AtpZ/AtpI family protein [Alphaproteobacteria bacterium]
MEELPEDIKDLDKRIKKFRQQKNAEQSVTKSQARVMIEGMFRMATEFVSPVLIALCIGYVADKYFNTKPVIMLVSVIFGCAAGVLNLYKAAQQMDEDINKE